MTPTPEQTSIYAHGSSTRTNMMIRAYAGTGKTTTLEALEKVVKEKPILYLVFGKRNADEAVKRMATTTTVRTFNSMGHRVWAKSTGKNLSLDTKKVGDILRQIIGEVPKRDQEPFWDAYSFVLNSVNRARVLGYIPEGKFTEKPRLCTQEEFYASLEEDADDFSSDLIEETLFRSIKAAYAGLIDFNDQVYMPAMFGGTFPRFPLVKVDEYQDLNPVNHEMLRRLVQGRLIGVGDPCQNIYIFRGAKSKGMAEAEASYSMTPFSLSVSFRCPEAIVKLARWRVPEFQWMKTGGTVDRLETLDPTTVPDDAVFLCRNNAPLLRTALRFLADGRSINVLGSDIGPRVVTILGKLGDDSMGQSSVLAAINDWLAERLAKGSTVANELADCMRVFALSAPSLGSAIAHAKHIFAQEGSIRFMTGHKAKGLEFEKVYHLDPRLLRMDEEQDKNLRYVIETRSFSQYFEISSDRILFHNDQKALEAAQ